jgi:hypothetical protein
MSISFIDMTEFAGGRGATPRFFRAASTLPTEVSGRRLTQRRVIDLKRRVAACCPVLLTQ